MSQAVVRSSNSSAFRALVVGAGGIANCWFPPLAAEGVVVTGVVDLRPEAAAAQIAKHGLACPAFGSLREALQSVGTPDFVVDLTVPEAHCAVTLEALRAGCHVIGEKPLAASMEQARQMVRASEETGKLYMVSQSRRWEPCHAQIRAAIAAGALGPLTTLNCDFYLGCHFGGFRDEMPSPLILDMAIHHFDLARLFCQARPVAVYAHEFNPAGSWYRGDVAASCIFEMANGLVFTHRGSWCAEGCPTSWHGDWRIIGQQGTLVYERDQPPRGQVVAGGDGFSRPLREVELPPPPAAMATGMHGALRELLAFLRNGTVPQTECHDNLQSLAMVFAAIDSARTRQRVAINL